MKPLILILTLVLMVGVVSATTYYVSNSGSDTNDGLSESTPFKTIGKVNTTILFPCDTVKFKSGDTWRFPSEGFLNINYTGNASCNITYTRYGSGNNPLFLGSINLSHPDNWSLTSDGFWNTTVSIPLDVQLFYNNSLGRKNNSMKLDEQGMFFYDSTNKNISVNSTINPALYYSFIEAGQEKTTVLVLNNNNIVLDGIEVKYSASHGIGVKNTNSTYVLNSIVSYCGGAYQTGTTRLGNCIEIYNYTVNDYIERNNVSYCFDACLTLQAASSDSNTTMRNVYFRNNLAVGCYYHFEYFSSGLESNVSNIFIEQNTFVHGNSIYFPNRSFSQVRMAKSPLNTSTFYFRNNIVIDSIYRLMYLNADFNGSMTFDYNLYYNSTSGYFCTWRGSNYATLAAFKAANGNESRSIESNPYFISNYQLAYNSIGCSMSSFNSYVGAFPCGSEQVIFNNATVSLGRNLYFSNTSDFNYSYSGGVMTVTPNSNYLSFKLSSTSPTIRNGVLLNGTKITDSSSVFHLLLGNIIYIGGS